MPLTLKYAAAAAVTACVLAPAPAQPADVIEELVVTSQRREQPRLWHPGNIDRLNTEVLDEVRHHHMHELLLRVSGVWLSRGSGQEHLTAIRSPVLTGAGSCGAFLFLEDGIPIRPAGFCNVNGIFEGRFDIILTNPPFGANVEPSDKVLESEITVSAAAERRYLDEYAAAGMERCQQCTGGTRSFDGHTLLPAPLSRLLSGSIQRESAE